jgi:hypothetical protein
VTLANRLLGRTADQTYVAENLGKLTTFPDLSKTHWAYYDVLEAANAHVAVMGDTQTRSK